MKGVFVTPETALPVTGAWGTLNEPLSPGIVTAGAAHPVGAPVQFLVACW